MLEDNRFTICVTGHRPGQLFGYDIKSSKYDKIKRVLRNTMISISNSAYEKCGVDTFRYMSGMALGIDTIFFELALELRQSSGEFTIETAAAIPFRGQEFKWPYESRKHYHELLEQADEIITVCKGAYEPWKLQRRNEFMVDHSDSVIAVYNGSKVGGTYNCVQYAKKLNKDITVINPRTGDISCT